MCLETWTSMMVGMDLSQHVTGGTILPLKWWAIVFNFSNNYPWWYFADPSFFFLKRISFLSNILGILYKFSWIFMCSLILSKTSSIEFPLWRYLFFFLWRFKYYFFCENYHKLTLLMVLVSRYFLLSWRHLVHCSVPQNVFHWRKAPRPFQGFSGSKLSHNNIKMLFAVCTGLTFAW